MKVENEQGLAEAIKNNQDSIEIEGDLAKKVIRIKATGTVAWTIAIGAIGVAVVGLLAAPATGGTTAGISGLTALGATSILGLSTTTAAVGIAVAAGGVGVLNDLREYDLKEISEEKIVLTKK